MVSGDARSAVSGLLSCRVRPLIGNAIGRKLLQVIVYRESCRIGGKLSVDDLVETSEIGDWKMPDFKMACSYAASQGWLIVEDDGLTLTTAGLAAA